jgi:DNA (cytosine-5)-methyltransferase 1
LSVRRGVPSAEEAAGNQIVVQPLAIRGREGGAELEAGEPGAPSFAVRATKVATLSISSYDTPRVSETIVRRLTPTECERLQGYDDGWTDGQVDSARYRQLGNSVAVPCVEWIARRLVEIYEGATS